MSTDVDILLFNINHKKKSHLDAVEPFNNVHRRETFIIKNNLKKKPHLDAVELANDVYECGLIRQDGVVILF